PRPISARGRRARRRRRARLAPTRPYSVRRLPRVAATAVGRPAGAGAPADGRSAPARLSHTNRRVARYGVIDGPLSTGRLPDYLFRQYLASPRQLRSNRPATSYA